MPDLLVSAGVDVAALERDFQRAAQTAQSFAATLARLNVTLPTPAIDLPAMERQGAAAGQAFSRGVGRGTKSDDPYRDIVRSAERAASVIGAAFGLSAIVSAADEYQNIANRLRSVSTSAAAAATAQGELFRIAQLTRSEYDATAVLFTRLTQASASLGLSQANVLRLTQTINEALVLGGGGAGESKRAVLDLAHGLSQGTLQARQLNQILAQAPALSQALADGLGVPVSKLREMGHEGALSVQAVVQALLGISGTVDREFAATVPTIGNGLTQVSNAFVRYIGQTSQASGAGRAVSASLREVADNFDRVAAAALAAGAVAVARSLGTPATALLADTRLAITAFQDRRTAALGAATTDAEWAAASLRASEIDAAAVQQRVASLATERQALAASLVAQREYMEAQALIAARPVAFVNASRIPRDDAAVAADFAARAAATNALGAANGRLFATEVQLERVDAALAAGNVAVAATTTAVSEAQTIATVTTARLATVQAETSLASAAAAGASRLFSGAVGLLGGEIGVAILAITGIVVWFERHKTAADEAREATERYRTEVAKLTPLKLEVAVTTTQLDVTNTSTRVAQIRASITALQQLAATATDPLERDRLTYTANRLAAQDLAIELLHLAEARAHLGVATAQQQSVNEAAGRTGLTSEATDAEIAQLARLRDAGQLRAVQEQQITKLVADAQAERARILSQPLPTDAFAKAQVNARVLELTKEIDDLTKSTKVDKQIKAELTLDARQAAKALADFRDRAEATRVELQLAVVLGAPPAEQAALIDALRAQYDAVAAAVAAGNRPAGQQLALVKEQLSAAKELQAVVLDTATRTSTRVALAPQLGFAPGDQQRAVAQLQAAYGAVVTEIGHMGGPLHASTDLLHEQIRLAEQLGGEFARLLAAPAPTVAQLVQPIDPAIRADLLAVRAALDDVAAARARVQLDKLTPPTLGHVAQFSADLATLEGASNTATAAQARLTAAMRTQGLSTVEQQRNLATLDAAYQAAGLSVDELATRVLNLARAGIARLALPTIHVPDLPVVPLAIVPRLEQVHITPQDLEHAVGGPLTATVHLRYVNAAFVDPTLQASIQRQIDAVQVAVTAANAAKTNVEINVVAKTDGVAAAREQFTDLQRVAQDAAESARRSIAAMAPGEAQQAAWKRYQEAVGTTLPPVRDLSATLRALSTGANGVLQIADAFGQVDENVRRALSGVTGLLSGLSDASAELARIQEAKGSAGVGDLFGSVAGIGSIVGIAGGLASLGAALFGQSAIEREHIAAVQRNSEALGALRAGLTDYAKTASAADAALHFLMSGGPIFNVLQNGGFSGFLGQTHTDINVDFLKTFGLTLDDLTAIAKRFGVELFDAKGHLITEALPGFVDAIELSIRALFTWKDTLDDLTNKQSLANDVFDFTQTDSPAQAMQRALDDASHILAGLTAKVPELFDRIFGGIDLHTAAGRSTLNDRLSAIMTEELSDEFKNGQGWLAELLRKSGFESLADFNKWLLTTDHALDDFTKTTLDATAALGNVPTAFKQTMDLLRFNATAPGLAGAPQPLRPTPLVPPTAPLPAGTSAGLTTPVVVHYYAVTIEPGAVTTTEQSGEAILASVDRAVVQRARATGGVNHPAAQGIVAALGRIGRATA